MLNPQPIINQNIAHGRQTTTTADHLEPPLCLSYALIWSVCPVLKQPIILCWQLCDSPGSCTSPLVSPRSFDRVHAMCFWSQEVTGTQCISLCLLVWLRRNHMRHSNAAIKKKKKKERPTWTDNRPSMNTKQPVTTVSSFQLWAGLEDNQ